MEPSAQKSGKYDAIDK